MAAAAVGPHAALAVTAIDLPAYTFDGVTVNGSESTLAWVLDLDIWAHDYGMPRVSAELPALWECVQLSRRLIEENANVDWILEVLTARLSLTLPGLVLSASLAELPPAGDIYDRDDDEAPGPWWQLGPDERLQAEAPILEEALVVYFAEKVRAALESIDTSRVPPSVPSRKRGDAPAAHS